VFVVGVGGVVVEMVNYERVSVGGEVDVELEEERDEGGRRWGICGEGEEDVAVVLGEVEEDVGREGGTESLQSGWEEEKMVVGKVAVHEERRIRLWCFIVDLVSPSCCSMLDKLQTSIIYALV